MFELKRILRDNIRKLKPYSSARDEYSGQAAVWLDANESPYENGVNRYPDPHQKELKRKLADLKNVDESQLFVGNGSDEVIDLLFRIVCEPRKSNVLMMEPTYGMYEVAARIQDVEVRKIRLNEDFTISTDALFERVDENSRILFICSPNNPTGNRVPLEVIEAIVTRFAGIVVVDEAYADFYPVSGTVTLLPRYPNLYVLQSLSKARGLAGARIGIGIASEEIQNVLAKVKPPYNVSVLNQQAALEALSNPDLIRQRIEELRRNRKRLESDLRTISFVRTVFPSDTNFLLVRFEDSQSVFDYLRKQGFIVRNRANEPGCENCLRITIGTEMENQRLLNVLKNFTE